MSREWMSLGFECLKPGDIHGFLCNAAMQAVGGALRLLGKYLRQAVLYLSPPALDASHNVLGPMCCRGCHTADAASGKVRPPSGNING